MAVVRSVGDMRVISWQIVMAVRNFDRVMAWPEQHPGRQSDGAERGKRQHRRDAAMGGL